MTTVDPAVLLVVDDDDDVRSTIAEALEEGGHRVVPAENGRVALDLLRAGARPHLILLDLMMPVLDGWGFRAEQERSAEWRAIPVVVMTAYPISGEVAQALRAAALLRKPVRLDELLGTVARVLAAPP